MRKNKALLAISIVISLLTFDTKSIAEEIVILGNELKPPKYYLENNKPKGILVDIMHYIDERLPSTFNIQLYPWKRAYSYALQGDGGIIGLSKNSERLEIFDYSDVMYYDTLILVVLKGNEFTYNDFTDLQGKIVGVERGSSYGEEFEKAKKILTFDEDGSAEQRLLKLLNKRIDVAIIGPGKVGLMSVIKLNEYLIKRKDDFSIISKPLNRDPNYLAFSKQMNMKKFIKAFNVILGKGYESGEIQKIIDSYSE